MMLNSYVIIYLLGKHTQTTKQDIFLFTGNLKANITQCLLSRKNGLLGNHKRVDQTNKVFEIPLLMKFWCQQLILFAY